MATKRKDPAPAPVRGREYVEYTSVVSAARPTAYAVGDAIAAVERQADADRVVSVKRVSRTPIAGENGVEKFSLVQVVLQVGM